MSPDARVRLPGTELEVSRLCLGGNRLGGELDREASFALLDAFVGAGGNFIDTARVYADWLPHVERSCSEKTIGRWLAARRGGPVVVVATKGGHPRLGGAGDGRLDPASLRADVEGSLDHLGLDRLDLFYLHRDDPAAPVGDILGALEALRAEGLIRHYGASNWSARRLEEARAAADRHHWQGFVANQPEWSLATRNTGSGAAGIAAMDAAMRALHRRTGLAAIPYSAQAKGYFDKVASGSLDQATAATYDNPRSRAVAAVLAELAPSRRGATLTQIMLASLMGTSFPTIPIIGCRTPAQVASSFRSLELTLPADAVARLHAAAAGES